PSSKETSRSSATISLGVKSSPPSDCSGWSVPSAVGVGTVVSLCSDMSRSPCLSGKGLSRRYARADKRRLCQREVSVSPGFFCDDKELRAVHARRSLSAGAGRHRPQLPPLTARSLAQRHDGVELAVVGERAGVHPLEASGARRSFSGERNEVGGDVNANHVDARGGQRQRVAARSAADVEHPLTRPQAERGTEEGD